MDITEYFTARPNWSQATKDRYKFILERLFAEIENPAHMGATELARWLAAQNWGQTFCYASLCCIRGWLRYQYGERHPALSLRIPRGKTPPQRTLSMDEVEILLGHFNTRTPKGRRDLSMCTLFIDTGLRVSEVARLSLKYIDLKERSLSVITKGGNWQPKIFSPYTCACLVTWLGDRAKIANPNVDRLYVGINTGQVMTRDGLKLVVKKWGKDAGIKKLSPHVFRRTFATLAIREGAPDTIIMAAGGWTDHKSYQRYVQAIAPRDIEQYSPVMAAMGMGRNRSGG